MADRLASPRPGGHLLRDLGLVVVLLEFCTEQRARHGGLAAEVMRGEIAARCGLTVDRVDDCNHALEQAGVLRIARRRAHNGGRYLPSVYAISEAPSAALQGGETVLPRRRIGTRKAAIPPPGDSATISSVSPPSIARAKKRRRRDRKRPSLR
jgi:enoyl-CoA hydratase/carnithine racemase